MFELCRVELPSCPPEKPDKTADEKAKLKFLPCVSVEKIQEWMKALKPGVGLTKFVDILDRHSGAGRPTWQNLRPVIHGKVLLAQEQDPDAVRSQLVVRIDGRHLKESYSQARVQEAEETAKPKGTVHRRLLLQRPAVAEYSLEVEILMGPKHEHIDIGDHSRRVGSPPWEVDLHLRLGKVPLSPVVLEEEFL
jgi:hypothetical protein